MNLGCCGDDPSLRWVDPEPMPVCRELAATGCNSATEVSKWLDRPFAIAFHAQVSRHFTLLLSVPLSLSTNTAPPARGDLSQAAALAAYAAGIAIAIDTTIVQ